MIWDDAKWFDKNVFLFFAMKEVMLTRPSEDNLQLPWRALAAPTSDPSPTQPPGALSLHHRSRAPSWPMAAACSGGPRSRVAALKAAL